MLAAIISSRLKAMVGAPRNAGGPRNIEALVAEPWHTAPPRPPTLKVIAHELVTVIRGNVNVDWMHRESARANIRRYVKRLLLKYGYPPDLQDAAVQNVLQQAEALSAEWAE